MSELLPNGETLLVNDGELLSRFATTGNQQAFSHLVGRHGGMVLRICRRISGGDPHAAEDAAQDVFLMLASRANALKTRMSVAGWLYRTAWHVATRQRRNLALRDDHETRAGIERAVTASAGDDAKDPIPFAVASSEPSDALSRALSNLPENYRNALVLHHVSGYTVEEAAQMLGVKVRTAAAWMSRGRSMMRDRLEVLVVGGVSVQTMAEWFGEQAPVEGSLWGSSGNLGAWSACEGGRRAISAAAAAGQSSAALASAASVAAPVYVSGKGVGMLGGLAAAAAGSVPGAAASGAVVSSVTGATSTSAAATPLIAAAGGAKAVTLGTVAVGVTVASGAALSGRVPDWRDASSTTAPPPPPPLSWPSSPSSGSSGAGAVVPEPSAVLPLMILVAFVVLTFRGRRHRAAT